MAGVTQRSRSVLRSFSLLVCMSVALAACGGGDDDTASPSSSGPQGVTPAPPPTASPAPTDPSPTPAPIPQPTEPTPAPINAPPTISGVAASSVTATSLYTFTPAAIDANGDTLAFQIQNRPAWATFNTVNGRLSGTPTLAQTGTYSNVVIRVSDGTATVELPAFSITVTAPATANTASLSWTPPNANEDGSALVDLAGYTIVYGPSSTMLHQTIRVENPGIDRYTIDNLPAGTYFFGVKAFTTAGVESAVSNVVSKVVQ